MSEAMNVPAPDELDELLSRRTGKINETLEALEVKVDLWDAGEPSAFRTLIGELRDDQQALSESARAIGSAASEEWHEVAGRLMRALERLESEVAAAWSDFEAEVAEDVDAYRAATANQLETWRMHVDTMRVHAKLAEMEARDSVNQLEQAFDAARPELEKAKETAAEAFEAAKESVRDFVAQLRTRSRDASRSLR